VVAVLLYDNRLTSISIVVAVLLYDNRFIAVTVTVTVMVTRPDCYANGPNTDPDLFCSGRHCAAKTCYGSNYHCKTNIHYGLLSL
jgi:hypothetical protein